MGICYKISLYCWAFECAMHIFSLNPYRVFHALLMERDLKKVRRYTPLLDKISVGLLLFMLILGGIIKML